MARDSVICNNAVYCKVYLLLISHFCHFFLLDGNFKMNSILTAVFGSVLLLSSLGFSSMAFADEYDFVAGIHNEITFHFRDGVETVNFPVFSTTSDIVSNSGTTFEVEGVIGDNPHLHKALDEAYTYRLSTLTGGSSMEYNYRFFDVDVNIVQNEDVLKSLQYKNCEVSEYGISTVTDDYESYLASNSGFAIVNSIEFRCGGVHINLEKNVDSPYPSPEGLIDYGPLPFTLAENVRTFLTFDFNHGAEKIESVIFNLTSGFNEFDYGTPSFQIITAVLPHPLIDNAIDKSQKVSGVSSSFNEDFSVYVELVSSEKLRGLDFEDCIVSGYDILTLRDGEEGYTGKRGFATAEVLDVECSGLTPRNPGFDKISNYKESDLSLTSISKSYNMGTGPHAIATFDFNRGVEVIDFPEFHQSNLIARANPTFKLVGVPSETPLLYDAVDNARKVGSKSTGVSTTEELFDVHVVLAYENNIVRGFDYTKCHVTDYMIKTEHDAEESFYKGFALTNEFDFECLGYHPYDPLYDSLFKTTKAKTESTFDRQANEKSTWGPNFIFGK